MNIINIRIFASLLGCAPSFVESWIRPCDMSKERASVLHSTKVMLLYNGIKQVLIFVKIVITKSPNCFVNYICL